MAGGRTFLLILAAGGMIVSCFTAVTSFAMAAVFRKAFPLPEAVTIFCLAAVMTFIHRGRGWHRINVIAFHGAGVLFCVWMFCRGYYLLDCPLWRLVGLRDFFMQERNLADWALLSLGICCILVLWGCGVRVLDRPADRTRISHRFDLGLAFFLMLLLVKLLMAVKGGVLPMTHSTIGPFFVFMVCGLAAMGLVSRGSAGVERSVIAGFKGAGVAAGFALMIVLLGSGLFIAFLPFLQATAETGSDWLKAGARPVGQGLIVVLRFLLTGGFCGWIRQMPESSSTGNEQPSMVPSGEGEGTATVFVLYIILGIILLILLAAGGFLLHRLARWLFAKTAEEKAPRGIKALMAAVVAFIQRFLRIMGGQGKEKAAGTAASRNFYNRLLRWGRFSGLRHACGETPREYARRLSHRFPRIRQEVALIVHLHDAALYGAIPPGRHQIARAKQALRRMRSPLLWYARSRSLFTNS